MRPLLPLAVALLVLSASPALACRSPAGTVRTIFTEQPETTPPDAELFPGRWRPGAAEPPAPGWGVPVGYLEQDGGRRLAVYAGVTSCHTDFRRDFGDARVWMAGRPLFHEGRLIGFHAHGRGRNGTADWSGRRR